MQINFTLTATDVSNVTKLLVNRNIKNNWSYTLQKIGVAAIVAIFLGATLLGSRPRSSTDLLVAWIMTGGLFLLTLVVYPRITQRDANQALQKAIKEGKYKRTFGDHLIRLTAEQYIHILDDVEMRAAWRHVKQVELVPDYILVSVLEDMDMIPRAAFGSEAMCLAFFQELNTHQQAAANRPSRIR